MQYMSASLLQQANHEVKSWHFEKEISEWYAKRFFEANVTAEEEKNLTLTHTFHITTGNGAECVISS